MTSFALPVSKTICAASRPIKRCQRSNVRQRLADLRLGVRPAGDRAGEYSMYGAFTVDLDECSSPTIPMPVRLSRILKSHNRRSMAHPYHHAVRSARCSAAPVRLSGHPRLVRREQGSHRRLPPSALRHHSEGIFLCESIFGTTLTNSIGKSVPVRTVGEQHVRTISAGSPRSRTGFSTFKSSHGWVGRRFVRNSTRPHGGGGTAGRPHRRRL